MAIFVKVSKNEIEAANTSRWVKIQLIRKVSRLPTRRQLTAFTKERVCASGTRMNIGRPPAPPSMPQVISPGSVGRQTSNLYKFPRSVQICSYKRPASRKRSQSQTRAGGNGRFMAAKTKLSKK